MVTSSRTSELAIIGAIATGAVVAFVALFLAMTNRTLGAQRSELWITLPTADGLRKGDPILHRGVQVGEVRTLSFDAWDRVLVRARLTQRVPLNIDAHAELAAVDMFGRQSVVLSAGERAGRALADGDTIIGVAPLTLTGRIEGVGQRVDRLLGDEMIDRLHTVLAGVEGAALGMERLMHSSNALVAGSDASLTTAAAGMAATFANLRAASDSTALVELRSALIGSATGLERVSARLDTATATLARSLERVDEGRGTIGRLAHDDALYDQAVNALLRVEELLDDVRRNPRRYLTVRVF